MGYSAELSDDGSAGFAVASTFMFYAAMIDVFCRLLCVVVLNGEGSLCSKLSAPSKMDGDEADDAYVPPEQRNGSMAGGSPLDVEADAVSGARVSVSEQLGLDKYVVPTLDAPASYNRAERELDTLMIMELDKTSPPNEEGSRTRESSGARYEENML